MPDFVPNNVLRTALPCMEVDRPQFTTCGDDGDFGIALQN